MKHEGDYRMDRVAQDFVNGQYPVIGFKYGSLEHMSVVAAYSQLEFEAFRVAVDRARDKSVSK